MYVHTEYRVQEPPFPHVAELSKNKTNLIEGPFTKIKCAYEELHTSTNGAAAESGESGHVCEYQSPSITLRWSAFTLRVRLDTWSILGGDGLRRLGDCTHNPSVFGRRSKRETTRCRRSKQHDTLRENDKAFPRGRIPTSQELLGRRTRLA